MRKILNLQHYTKSIVTGMIRGVAFGTTAAVTMCLASTATAQTAANALIPTASSTGSYPVSSAVATNPNGTAAVNDASYSVLSDSSRVEPAAYLGQLGGFGPGYQFSDPCSAGCDVTCYVQAEALYLDRNGDKYFSLTRNAFLPEFEYELGGRYTFGTLMDCVNGFEGVYVGPFDWNRRATVTGAGNVDSLLRPGGGYTFNEIDAFNDADIQTSDWRVHMQSFEANRKWWVWDVLSTLVGVRYIDYEEDFAFFSSGANGAGLQVESLDNQLAGIQAGAELLYPTSLRCSMGFRGKAGAYGNFSERRAFLNNDGSVLINAGDTSTDLAGVFEFGVFANYAIVPSIRLTAGYEFWWLTGVATVEEQAPTIITPATGTTVFAEDDVLLHGGSAGVQILF